VNFVPLERIRNNPNQPRQEFKDTEIIELAESIRALGVIQPVLLRPSTQGDDHLEIVAGERRWRAAKLAGLETIPAIIRPLSERETLEIALVENIQRSNLNPIEEALAFQRLIDEFQITQKELSERVGRDRASISNFLRLLKLPPEVVQDIRDGKLLMGHAKAILTVKEPAAQLSLARKTIAESLSVRALEQIVSRVVVLDSGRASKPEANTQRRRGASGAFPEVIDLLRNRLGTKVLIKHHESGRGRIEIEYFSEQELDRLVDVMTSS
jgi:ParB family chromosome partitioning protein